MTSELDRALEFMDHVHDRAAERVEPFDHGTALVHERLALVHDLNFLRLRRGEPDADELAAEAERIQAPAGMRHRSVDVREADEERLAPGFEALGWEHDRFDVMAAHREPDREGEPGAVEEVGRDDLRPAWAEGIRSELSARGLDDDVLVEQLVEHKRVIAEAVPTRYFAARPDGSIASYCELYERGGVAQIEALMTLEAFRGRGLASAVVLHALAKARAGGGELVFLTADRDDWPARLYVKLGFERLGGYARFIRRRPGA